MRRGGTWLAAIGAVLALAACGGEDARPEEPALPRGLAERLAEQSEAIANKLDAGDTCGAAQEADILNDQAQAAVDAGEVPPAFQSELIGTVNELVNTVNCPPPPPPPEDCEALEEEKKALEERKKDAEEAEKEQLEADIKALEEEIKACKEGRGGGEGNGGEG